MDKHQVAQILEEMALYLDVAGMNLFRIRAYQKAARTIENLEDFEHFLKESELESLPGIGKDLSKKIKTIIQLGYLPELEELKKIVPVELLELLNIPGLGGKKIKILYDTLGIKNLDDLNEAISKDKIAGLKGFGRRSQESIKENLAKYRSFGVRLLYLDALRIAEPILLNIRKLHFVTFAEIAGSLRRKLETVGDIDFLVASTDPEKVMDWFIGQSQVEKVISKGTTKCSVRLKRGLQSDLRVVSVEQFPFSLLYFTGSKEHNIHLRMRANEQELTLNEYSLTGKECNHFKAHSEEEIYQTLHLPYIPPELREGRGEIQAAEKNALPRLIVNEDIRGTFHCHTTETDGHNTLEEMAHAAQDLGWEYLGIADHSKSSYQVNGMDEIRLLSQLEKIRELNRSRQFKIHLFAGLECDVMADGSLDFGNDILKELDYVVVSIHRRYKQDENEATRRIIKAIENPYTTMVGHLTGRILLRRDPNAINVEKAIDAAIANNVIIEINGYPNRLDMDWRYWHKALERGLKCCINPDAHKIRDLQYVYTGVNIARKGWLEKKDVLNCFPLQQVQTFCKTRKWPSQ